MSQLICSNAFEHLTGAAESKEGARDHTLIVGKYRKLRRIKWGKILKRKKGIQTKCVERKHDFKMISD